MSGGHNIWVLAEAYDYVAQFQPNKGVKEGKQTASSAKWEEENVDMQLMKCLPLTVIYTLHLFVQHFTKKRAQ